MSIVADRTYTPEELLRMPDAVAYELVNGHLVERNVSETSSRVAARIIHLLSVCSEKTKDVVVYGPDLGYQCFPSAPGQVRKADVSAIKSSQLQGLDDPGYMPIPADLVIEVISPNDNAYEVDQKVGEYLAAGFGLVWVVYPKSRTVLVYRPDGSVNKLHEGDEITGENAVPGFRCKVAEFFRK